MLVVCVSVGVLVMSASGILRLRFDTDVLSLLPSQGRAIPAFREFLRHFGGADHLYIVFTAPPGHRIDEYRLDVDAWISELRRVPEIVHVDSGTPDDTRDWAWLAERQLLLLQDARLETAIARLRPDGMQEALLETRALLVMPSTEVADLVRQDPLGLFALLRDELGQAQAGLNLGGGPEGYTTPDGTRRLVIARPTHPPYDTRFSGALFARLEQLRQSLNTNVWRKGDDTDESLPPVDVAFAGGHRIAIETEQIVRRESITNSLGSLALILPLLFLVYRSAWLVTVGAIPSALSLALVLGLLGFNGATLSAAATGAAAMMFGLGVDGVVLLYSTHRLAQSSGASDEEVDRRVAAASTSMLLGMWTTAATFYGLMLVDFPSLTQLGTLVGHSMAVCGILTLLLVPALLPSRRGPDRVQPVAPSPTNLRRAVVMPNLAAGVLRHRRTLLIGTVLVTLVLGILATRVRVNPTLGRLRSVSAGAQFWIEMARAFGLPEESYVVLARGRQLEILLQHNEHLVKALHRRLPTLSIQAPSTLLPSAGRQSVVRARIARELPPAGGIVDGLRRTSHAAGFNPGAFLPFERRVPQMTSPDIALSVDAFAAHGLGDLIQRFITRDGESWLLATYVFPKTDSDVAAVEQLVSMNDSDATLTGLPLVNRELSAAFVPQFLRGLVIGSIAVVVLIALTFRDWRLSLLVLSPTAIGLVWGAGVLGALGIELDLFAMFAVVTFIGIGVDYGVHMVHRYRDVGEVHVALAELAPVILVAGAITVLGYGTLVISSYPPLRSMGLVSIVSVISLVAASVVVLPVLLASRSFRRA